MISIQEKQKQKKWSATRKWGEIKTHNTIPPDAHNTSAAPRNQPVTTLAHSKRSKLIHIIG